MGCQFHLTGITRRLLDGEDCASGGGWWLAPTPSNTSGRRQNLSRGSGFYGVHEKRMLTSFHCVWVLVGGILKVDAEGVMLMRKR